MQVGFNNNIVYKGESYHIQTEDGGRDNPVITTMLFKEGVVVASKKTSYADILKFEQLETLVRELMREQHAGVLKDLKNGRCDLRISKGRGIDSKTKDIKKEAGRDMVSESMDEIILEYLVTENDNN